MKELIGFRTITRGDETVRIPIYKKNRVKGLYPEKHKASGKGQGNNTEMVRQGWI